MDNDLDEIEKPITSFGVITDIHYVDLDDAFNYDRDRIRYYRNSLRIYKDALKHWTDNVTKDNIKFAIQIGDFIDHKASKHNQRDEALNTLLTEHQKITSNKFPLYHIWGNHELLSFLRTDIVNTPLNTARELNGPEPDNANYYSVDVAEHLRLLCLDLYEFSALGYATTNEMYIKAMALLKQNNPNDNYYCDDNMDDVQKRFNLFNGSLSDNQLKWLEKQLIECKQKSIKVIVVSHIPFVPQASNVTNLPWNFDEILSLLHKFEGTVIATFHGHFHQGGYHVDEHSIHHITFVASIETLPQKKSFATIKVHKDKLIVQGYGQMHTYTITFKN